MSVQNSSSITPGIDVTTSSIQPHEWDVTGQLPDRPKHADYGYVINGQVVGSTRELLSEVFVKHGSEISFVWTPDTPELVGPEHVPFLLDAFRRMLIREARNALLLGAVLISLGVALGVGLQDWTLIYSNLFFVFGAVVLTEGIWRYARSRHYTHEDAVSDAGAARFASWLQKKSTGSYTVTLAGYFAVVWVVQEFSADSIEAAGLVKPAVRDGEIWRLFTATLMHANFTHFWMNLTALLHFSKIIEHTLQRAFVPLVFLLTGAFGSVFSVLLYPNTTSIGASGGLLGLLGFITIAAHFDRTRYPPKYFRRMIQGIVLIGALGLFGFALIDNAAHLGGLSGGLLLGWFFFGRNRHGNSAQEKLLKFAALATLVALGFIAAFAVYRMLV